MTTYIAPLLSDREQRTLDRILQVFERTEARSESLYSRVRKHDRLTYRSTISFMLPRADGSFPEQLSALPTGWAYSLSQGGIGFISQSALSAESLAVALYLPNSQVKWMTGRVVRFREIPSERYFDYGVAFGRDPESSL